jgi:hypothetical protein
VLHQAALQGHVRQAQSAAVVVAAVQRHSEL